jgi:uncharacterized membrane protein YhhN
MATTHAATERVPVLWRGGARVAFALFGLVAGINVVANLADALWPEGAASSVANVSQYLLMPVLALAVWVAVRSPRPALVRWSVVALGFSWVGDTAPDLVGRDLAFLAMMGGFLVAQIAYIVAFWPLRRESLATRPWALVVGAAVLAALIAVCASGAGSMLVPVVIYGACLVSMALLSSGVGRIAGVGGALFLVSDLLIALGEFSGLDLAASGFWVMLTYVVAQALIAEGVVRRASRGAAA